MARLFEIKPPEGMTTLQLDSQRRGTIHYTVKNVSAREIDGRATVVAVPPAPMDPNHPVQKGWVKLDGPADKHFGVNKDDTYTVNVAIPPKAEPGTYSFRLDVNWVAKPDEGDSSQAIKFEIQPVQVKEVKWGLLALFAVLFLCVLGALGYFLTRHTSGNSVPNLVGMTVPQATAALMPAKLNLNQKISKVVGKPEDLDHIVSQDPVAGAPIPADLSVKVTIGAAAAVIPTGPENPPPPPPITPPTGRFGLVNANSKLCLSPAGGQTDNNRPIVQYTCDGDPARYWSFHVVGDGVVQVVNSGSQRCLTVAGGNTVPADPAVQFNCDSDPSRQWQFVVQAGSPQNLKFRLINVNSKLCLTMAGGATALNAEASQNTCDDYSLWQANP